MKKIFYLLTFSILVFGGSVYGQTKTASPSEEIVSPTSAVNDSEIQKLKDKLATKVAELKNNNNRAVSGFITEKSQNSLNIRSGDNQDYVVTIDPDLTKFFQIIGTQSKEVNYETLKNDDYIFAAGIISEKNVTANTVYIDDPYVMGLGTIAEVNKEDYYIRIVGNDKANYTLDIETYTKQEMLNIKTLDIEKIGFSKVREGDTVIFTAKDSSQSNKKEQNRFSAQKFLIIPQEYFLK